MNVLSRRRLHLFAISALIAAASAAHAGAPQPPQFTELGHDFPSFETASQWGFAVGDFDGDGRDDFAFAGRTGQVGFWSLSVVGKDATNTVVFKQQMLVPDDSIQQVLAVPQPSGGPHVLTIAGNGTVREYAGWPLGEVQSFATIASVNAAAAGNIFGDGTPRVAVRSDTQLGVYVIATGTVSWLHPSSGTGDVLLAQLDADPELEIVLGSYASPGFVLDGLTGAVDWQYPDAFGQLLAAGPLGPNKEIEFVGAQNQITVFSGAPYSPLWDFVQGLYFTPGAVSVGDLNGDGRAEIIYSSQYGVQVIDSLTHLQQPLGSANFTGSRMILVDLDGNGKKEILYGDAINIGVVDGTTGLTVWQVASRNAHFNAVAVGDIDADGQSEFLTGYGLNYWDTAAAGLQIRDMATGANRAILVPDGGNANEALQVASTRILIDRDLPASPQIVLAGSAVYDGRVVVIDGKSRTITAQIGAYATAPFDSRYIADAALIDMDGDGSKDIVVASQPDLSWVTGAKLQAFTMSGQPIWESVGMGTSSFAINSVFALTPDSGAGDVVVAVLPGSLRAFDRLSHLLSWTFLVQNNGAVVVPHGATGVEIAVENDTMVTFYDAATRDFLRQYTLSDPIDAITPLDGQLNQLLVSSGGQLRLIDGTTGIELASSPWLGDSMAKTNQLAVESFGAGIWRIGIGGTIGTYRYQLFNEAIFSSGFDSAP